MSGNNGKAMDNGAAAAPAAPAKRARSPLTWKKRIALIAFGTVLGLVLLEVFLRSIGFVYYFERRYRPGDHPENAFVILCLGDSCTQGQGASDEEQLGYPGQLQHILDTRHPERDYRVVNMGFAGANSSQLARRFEGFVRLHEPDLAVILIGNNDVWNQNESRLHLVGRGKRAKASRRLRARLRLWGDNLRVVRLARCIVLSVDDDRERGWNPGEDRNRGRLWNPDEDTSPNRYQFKKGAEILGDIEQIKHLYRLNFNQISEIAESCGVELLWLDYHKHARFRETDHIDPILEELGAPYVDLAPYFWDGEQYNEDLLARDDWHPNDLGYTVFARAVYNKIVELGYAAGPPIEVLEDLTVHQ